MATRFYLPSAGSSPLPTLALASQWEGAITGFFRAPAVLSKSGTPLADVAGRYLANGTNRQDCWGQWVSPPLASDHDFLTTEKADIIVRGLEADAACNGHLAFVCRVVSGDGATDRGVIRLYMGTSTELATSAATRVIDSAVLTARSAYAGDRLVIEIGTHSAGGSNAYDVTWRFGDPSDTDDFAKTANLTTDLCPWFELSPDLTFADEGGSPPPTMTTMRGVW